ncbi:MAG TPA: PAS domain-containing protein [Steroidobacteraceae bacterium]|nr:PAS domain-containing protein [Steroidobacteraceae bacterium]
MKIPFQALIEQITDQAIVVLDKDGIIQSWNAGARKITGYSAGEAVGRPLGMLLEESVVRELVDAGAASAHCWLMRKQGQPLWTRNVVQRVSGENGSGQALCWVCQDPFDN